MRRQIRQRRFLLRVTAAVLGLMVVSGLSPGQTLDAAVEGWLRFQHSGAWQQYSTLELSLAAAAEPQTDFLFEATDGELKLHARLADGTERSFFLIPNVVYMRQGFPPDYEHHWDSLEYYGLLGQWSLFFIEQAFPAGPEGLKDSQSRSLSERETEHTVRFLAGRMDILPPWQAEVTARRESAHRIAFEIIYSVPDGDALRLSGSWSDAVRPLVLPDSEPLADWTVTYQGLAAKSSFVTLGDVRMAARGPGLADRPTGIESHEALERFLQGYYLDPAPELVADAIRFIDREAIASNKDASAPMLAFFCRVFADNQQSLSQWKKVIAEQGPPTRKLMRQAMRSKPETLLAGTPPGALLNDMYWASFFASGDTAYIVKLVAHLRYLQEAQNPELFMTGATAMWSLNVNARMHPKVREVLVDLRHEGSPARQSALEDILTKTPDQLEQQISEALAKQ